MLLEKFCQDGISLLPMPTPTPKSQKARLEYPMAAALRMSLSTAAAFGQPMKFRTVICKDWDLDWAYFLWEKGKEITKTRLNYRGMCERMQQFIISEITGEPP